MDRLREVGLDTETTGLDPGSGHRVVEIGCVELINHLPTGRTFQAYLNPDRAMPSDAFAVHGLSDEFLSQQKRFVEIARAQITLGRCSHERGCCVPCPCARVGGGLTTSVQSQKHARDVAIHDGLRLIKCE